MVFDGEPSTRISLLECCIFDHIWSRRDLSPTGPYLHMQCNSHRLFLRCIYQLLVDYHTRMHTHGQPESRMPSVAGHQRRHKNTSSCTCTCILCLSCAILCVVLTATKVVLTFKKTSCTFLESICLILLFLRFELDGTP